MQVYIREMTTEVKRPSAGLWKQLWEAITYGDQYEAVTYYSVCINSQGFNFKSTQAYRDRADAVKIANRVQSSVVAWSKHAQELKPID